MSKYLRFLLQSEGQKDPWIEPLRGDIDIFMSNALKVFVLLFFFCLFEF